MSTTTSHAGAAEFSNSEGDDGVGQSVRGVKQRSDVEICHSPHDTRPGGAARAHLIVIVGWNMVWLKHWYEAFAGRTDRRDQKPDPLCVRQRLDSPGIGEFRWSLLPELIPIGS